MAISVVRLGAPRDPAEGLRLGAVRRPPRGIRKSDFARLDYFDVWVPDLAPSAPLVASVTGTPPTAAGWARFARRYRTEMKAPQARRLIQLLAAMSAGSNFSVGCYCADETRCHRSLLKAILADAGAAIVS